MLSNDFNMSSIWDNLSFLLKSVVISLDQVGETVLSGDKDLLSAWELELGSSKGFLGVMNVFGFGSDRQKNLSNADSCGLAKSFTESSSHTLLESIGTSA